MTRSLETYMSAADAWNSSEWRTCLNTKKSPPPSTN
jgi:hypothetical protein